ncbi:hypothetical protein WHR41_09117 [Cladosporium halotolerans]|uniref:Uncharacterized protein n=1 Tax=Cladosporium halotolerans TaxID=1052096 RepID=A0AB34KFX5_9PEZI
MALTESVPFEGALQQHYKMSIAFLAGDVSEPEPMDTEMTDNCFALAPVPASVPRFAASIFQMPCYQPKRRPRTPITLLSLRLHCSPHTRTQIPRIGSLSSLNSINSVTSANSWADCDASSPRSASNFSSIKTSPAKRHDSLWDLEPGPSATSYHSNNSFRSTNATRARHQQGQPNHTEPLAQTSPPARPSYSEEQKFFIMYCRVIKEQSWPEVEDNFALFFKPRTKDGLTSVYYRIRKDWGMEEVLKIGPGGTTGDRRKVEDKAAYFSRDFLNTLGCFD